MFRILSYRVDCAVDLIQASDVAHTMQHWHVYRKWNERFFIECYAAFKNGRAEKDPSTRWYEGELGFFDFYIIPLAKKLKECGVFGVSSGEYLDYAMKNRNEWGKFPPHPNEMKPKEFVSHIASLRLTCYYYAEAKGRDVVESMLEKLQQEPE